MSISVGPKIYLRGAEPNTHTWWLWPPTSSLRSWLHFGALLLFLHFPWEVSHVWSSDVFEFCNHEKLVPLSVVALSQAYPPQKNQENIPNLHHKLKIPT
jgi:hypothetical protein